MSLAIGDLRKHSGATGAKSLLRVVVVSAGLLVPCFWQPHIQCTDLPSHLYNAWLHIEIDAGRLNGLSVAHPKTNFLVDDLLAYTLKRWGPVSAERIVVGFSVLVFFWGAFRFLSRILNRHPWDLTPLLAMLAYGVIFRWGFLNFYLSAGLSLWAASFWWAAHGIRKLSALLPLGLAVSAQTGPPLWVVLVVTYVCLADCLRSSGRIWLFGASLAALVVGHFTAQRMVHCEWLEIGPRVLAGFIGVGQLIPYGVKYWALVVPLILVCLPSLYYKIRDNRWRTVTKDTLAQLFLLHIVGSALSPDGIIDLPGYNFGFYYINARLSLLTALLGCALLGRMALARWRTAALIAISIGFFAFSYADERALNRFEARVQALISTIPPGQRIVMMMYERSPIGGQQPLLHILDRPCIFRCYDYGNYEPATASFLVRADRPNPYVLWNVEDVDALYHGTYLVKQQESPVYEIRACGGPVFTLCKSRVPAGRRLQAGAISVIPKLWRSPIVE